MNVQSKDGKPNIPWMKFALIGVVLIAVVIFSGREGIEKLLDLKPGTLGGQTAERSEEESSESPKFDVDTNWKNSSDDSGSSDSGSSDFEFVRDGRVMRSPEGLTYDQYRIDHVMLHAKDNLNKLVHGVFTGSENEIFAMIDEAYRQVKANSKQVVNTKPDSKKDRVAYDVRMGGKIGYKGGRSGRSDGHPDLTVLRLVLENDTRVITAFPAR